MYPHLSSWFFRALKGLLAFAVIPLLALLKLARPRFAIQVMSTNHQFFGHLALEPDKYLSARAANLALQEALAQLGCRTYGTE